MYTYFVHFLHFCRGCLKVTNRSDLPTFGLFILSTEPVCPTCCVYILYVVRLVICIPFCRPSSLVPCMSSFFISVSITVMSLLFESPSADQPGTSVLRFMCFISLTEVEQAVEVVIFQRFLFVHFKAADTGANYMNRYYSKKKETEDRRKGRMKGERDNFQSSMGQPMSLWHRSNPLNSLCMYSHFLFFCSALLRHSW